MVESPSNQVIYLGNFYPLHFKMLYYEEKLVSLMCKKKDKNPEFSKRIKIGGAFKRKYDFFSKKLNCYTNNNDRLYSR